MTEKVTLFGKVKVYDNELNFKELLKCVILVSDSLFFNWTNDVTCSFVTCNIHACLIKRELSIVKSEQWLDCYILVYGNNSLLVAEKLVDILKK